MRRKKPAVLIIGILCSILLSAGTVLAVVFIPVWSIRNNSATILSALAQYRANHGRYPGALGELVPEYLNDLAQPGTTWGWLYTSDGNDFTIGYVYWVDKWGYGICRYPSKTMDWDCPEDYSTEPFTLAPTPGS